MFDKRICLKTGLARIALDKMIRFPRMAKAADYAFRAEENSLA